MIEKGTILAGYRIDGILAHGGMGVLYKATQLSLQRTVAIKVLPDTLSQDPVFRERFRREGMLQAAIDHPHIVTVHEAGESEYGLFLAMRLIHGSNLKDLILGGSLDAKLAMHLLSQVAGALDTAHDAGLVHRDIKPQNILVGARNHAYLADFGLTRALGSSGLTRRGEFVGTLDYISPEQIRGEPPSVRSDIYALAAVLYECLTGYVPYPKETDAAVLFAHLSDPPPSVVGHRPELPAALDDVIAKGMAKEPLERHAAASELVSEAERIVRSAVTDFAPPAPVASAEDAGPRTPAAADTKTTPRGEHKIVTPEPPRTSATVARAIPAPSDAEVLIQDSVDAPAPVATSEEVASEGAVRADAPAPEVLEEAPQAEPVSEPVSAEPEAAGELAPMVVTPLPAEPEAEAPAAELLAEPISAEPEAEAPEAEPISREPEAEAPEAEPVSAEPEADEEPAEIAAPVSAVDVDETVSPATFRRRRTLVTALISALLLGGIAFVGYTVGSSGTDDEVLEPEPQVEAQRQSAGSIALEVPGDWQPATSEEIPGIDFTDPLRYQSAGGDIVLIAGTFEAEGPTLLPESFLELLPTTPEREPVRLGAQDAYRYVGLEPQDVDGELAVYAVPTTRGIAGVACWATESGSELQPCESVAATLELNRGTAYPLGPSRVYARSLNAIVEKLDDSRAKGRKQLARAETSGAQARAAASVGRAYAAAARAVRKLDATPEGVAANAAIAAEMERAGAAYRDLAGAARGESRNRYAAAARRVEQREAAINEVLGRLEQLGYTAG